MTASEKLIRTAGGGARARLVNMDCLEGMAGLEAGSVDVVVTSPPYNLGIKYEGYDDGGSRTDYLRWTGRWFAAVKRLLNGQGSFFLNIGSRPKDPWVPFEVLAVAREHFRLQNVFHWVKSISVMKENDVPVNDLRAVISCAGQWRTGLV